VPLAAGCHWRLVRQCVRRERHWHPRVDVYFRLFDVDDPGWPRTDQRDSVDDDTGTMYNDNYPGGNKGAVLNDTPDTVGGATLFKVTLTGLGDTVDALAVITQPYPGNNWRFAASTRKAWLEGVYIDNSDGMTLKDSEGDTVPECKRTQTLTCWRYVHVEVDSMGAPEANPPPEGSRLFGTLPPGTSTLLDEETLDDDNADWRPSMQLVGAEVDPKINDDADTQMFEIWSNHRTYLRVDALPQATLLDKAETGDTYLIKTDDVHPGDMDAVDTGLLARAFAPARITPTFDTGKETHDVPFERYGMIVDFPECRGTGDERDMYWCVYLLAAYEATDANDWDPNDEWGGYCAGICKQSEPEYAHVYKETIRDVCADPDHVCSDPTAAEQSTVCHEVGEQFELSDETGSSDCIMGPLDEKERVAFCAVCIKRIRHPELGHP